MGADAWGRDLRFVGACGHIQNDGQLNNFRIELFQGDQGTYPECTATDNLWEHGTVSVEESALHSMLVQLQGTSTSPLLNTA